jgi:hypothetical protein
LGIPAFYYINFFTCTFSWFARAYYLIPIEEHMDDNFQYYFRCNSTLANEGSLYNVDCRLDMELSETSFIKRRDDATKQCYRFLPPNGPGAKVGVI